MTWWKDYAAREFAQTIVISLTVFAIAVSICLTVAYVHRSYQRCAECGATAVVKERGWR